MSKGGKKKRSTAGLILDVVLTLCTCMLWLILILIRYLRNNSLQLHICTEMLNRVSVFFLCSFLRAKKTCPFMKREDK